MSAGRRVPAGTRTPGRRRRWPVVVLLLAGAGLVAAGGPWALGRAGWWLSPAERAERLLAAGRLPEAGTLLNRWIRDEPRQAEARLLYARFLRLSGLPREADAALGKAMGLGAPEASLWREYGLLLAAPDFRRAEPILLRALEARPDDLEVLRAVADGYSRQGRWPDAADLYSRWLRAEPARAEALLGRSRALVQAGRGAEAVAELRAFLARAPADYDARMFLANSLLNNADLAEAEPELARAHQLRPDRPEPLVGLAACAGDREDWDRARQLLDRALLLDPSSLLALAARASLELNRRRYDPARADFERVVALDPRNKPAHMHLAQLYHRAGDPARAAEHEQAYRHLQAEQEEAFRTLRGMPP